MKKIISLSFIALVLMTTSCKKKTAAEANVDPRIPPDMVFKTGTVYTSSNITATRLDT